ncbi:MAG: hypothetical protein H6920_11265 [Sphingomonadaceae bacterium]|nr:hypothetical protein [Altererythrobacter sp.]MCP5392185.1 hypothetical protein [Sphingomonadaceae bacterium]MCP5394265.1 hypothetical protein [Sphingomonadaceae bacterium]
MQWLYDLKLLAVDFTGLEKDALHIYIALLVFVAVNMLFGWKARDGKALPLVLIVAIANELSDIRYNLRIEHTPYFAESVHDIANTMFVPVLLFILARWTRVFGGKDSMPSGDETEV